MFPMCPRCQLKVAGSKTLKYFTVIYIEDVQHYQHTKVPTKTMCGREIPLVRN